MRVRSLKLGDCFFDNGRRAIVRDGQTHRLEPRDYAVLLPLLDHAPDAVSSNSLMRRAWHNKIVGDNALHQSIGRLRKAFGDSARAPRYIQTLPKMGYRFIAGITPLTPPEEWQVQISPIAVLPFRDFTGGDHEYLINSLCFGISHHLTDERVEVLRLDVAPRGRVSMQEDLSGAIRSGARTILEGALIMDRGRLRLNCTLLDLDSHQQLWSQRYDLGTPQMFELPGELPRTVVTGIRERLDTRKGPRRSAGNILAFEDWGT